MTTAYPGAVDSFDTHVDNVDDVMAADVNNLNDAMVATQTTLGSEGAVGLCEGRLSLVTATPIVLADQTAKTTVYWVPFKGNRISLYDGSAGWDTLPSTEKSVAVPGNTTTPFDIFGYNSSGTLAIEATAWTNDTTRATALALQDGVYVKTGATTRRYLGTGRTTGVSGQCEDSYAKRFLWNYYSRILQHGYTRDDTSHTYTTTSYRSWNNDATLRTEFIVGAVETRLAILVNAMTDQQAGEGQGYVSAGYDTATASSMLDASYSSPIGFIGFAGTQHTLSPAVGYHYVQAVEYGHGTSPDFDRVHVMVQFEG